MVTIHHLDNSRSQRVLWLMEELGLSYEVKRYERQKDLRAPLELRTVHPLGKSPVLTEEGLTLAETGAIVDYLVETHGGGRLGPAAAGPERWRYRHFLHHAEGTAMPPLVMALVFSRIAPAAPMLLRPIMKAVMGKVDQVFLGPQLEALADYWEESLRATGWFAGQEIGAADIMMSFPVETGAQRIGYAGRPRLREFLARIHARPAYRAALERGGPYAYA